VELLIEEERPRPVAAPPPQLKTWVKDAVASPLGPWTLALEVGAAGLGSFGGLPPALAPAARLRAAVTEMIWLRVSALGLGTRPTVTTHVGSARVGQNFVLVEGCLWFRPRKALRPLASLGLGAARLVVEGTASTPYQGEVNARWFAAADAGVGLSWRPAGHWEILVEAHALVAAPRPAVYFFDIEAAKAGQPTLMLMLTLAGGA
jgi:hypothetical protein